MATVSSAERRKLDPSALAAQLGLWSAGDGPLYRQLAGAVGALVAAGGLRAGDRLPPERALAVELAVSRGTVVRAYDLLAEDGAVERRQGSGTTVTGTPRPPTSAEAFVGERLWASQDTSIDLLKAIPTVLPEVLDAVAATDLANHAEELDGAEPLGWWALRDAVAQRYSRQGLTTTPHQVMITSGAQQAIALVVRATIHAGDVVLGEEVTWPGLIDTVNDLGARFEPVALDAEGIVVDDLERKIIRHRPALLAVNPQHHNPTGSRLPAARTAAIAELARAHDVTVVEDRVAADLGFDRAALPFIEPTDGHAATVDVGAVGRVSPIITVGSVCKVAWPGLRVGWLRSDAQTVRQLRVHKAVDDMFTSALSQAATLTVLADYDRLIDVRIAQLRARRDLVLDVLGRDLPDWEHAIPRGGMCVWVTLPADVSADAFADHAARLGVTVATGRQFGAGALDSRNLRIPYTAEDAELAEGLRRLVAAWRTFDPRQATPPAAVI